MNIAYKYNVFPFLVDFALGDTRIHINTSYCGNMLANVKVSVN